MTEEWRDIPGYRGWFQVNKDGQVLNVHNGKIKKPTLSNRGYHICSLTLDGITTTWSIHRLVMLTFAGDCPEGMEVNHKNGNPLDNRFENLEYCTPKENIHHARNVLKRGYRIKNEDDTA